MIPNTGCLLEGSNIYLGEGNDTFVLACQFNTIKDFNTGDKVKIIDKDQLRIDPTTNTPLIYKSPGFDSIPVRSAHIEGSVSQSELVSNFTAFRRNPEDKNIQFFIK